MDLILTSKYNEIFLFVLFVVVAFYIVTKIQKEDICVGPRFRLKREHLFVCLNIIN